MKIEQIDTPRIIGDPIHGYIGLTELEYDILQLPTLLRLHRIKQTATAYLTFPSSLTSRFGHVIGALHLGSKIITQLLRTIDESIYNELFPEYKQSDVTSIIKAVRFACLFHDIGHGPFSHSAEDIMKKYVKITEAAEAKSLFNISSNLDIPIHEFYSYKLVTNGEIRDLISKFENDRLLVDIGGIICKDPSHTSFKRNPEGFGLLRKIVSSQLDADRMDYLLRDSSMSGVKYGQIDVERVIGNMTVFKKKIGGFELAIYDRALGSIEDMLDARFKMYKWFYNHHSVIATNLLIEGAMSQMVSDGLLNEEFFHWTSYESALNTDDYVLNKLAESINGDQNQYLPYKGLIDRRYIPISLLKHRSDWKKLLRAISEHSGTETNYDNKIKMFFERPQYQDTIKQTLEKSGEDIKDVVILGVNMPRSPYQPLNQDDKDNIWICGKGDRLTELTKASSYFKRINDEWSSSPSVYISYLVPGKTKKECKNLYDKIFKLLTQQIAASQ